MKTIDRAKHALWDKSRLPHDENGYVEDTKDNLMIGVTTEMVRSDYQKGSGQEWLSKIRAIHSSSALAANAFGEN